MDNNNLIEGFKNLLDNSPEAKEEIVESLRQFQYQNLLQKEIRFYLAKLFSDKEVSKLKKAFTAVDKDNSGEIEYEEIPLIFKELGIEASDVSIYLTYVYIYFFIFIERITINF